MSIREGHDEEEGVWPIEEERMWPTEKPETQRISATWARTPKHEPARKSPSGQRKAQSKFSREGRMLSSKSEQKINLGSRATLETMESREE